MANVAAEQFRGLVGRSPDFWDLEELAGNYEVAAELLGRLCDRLANFGRPVFLAFYGAELGRILCALGRYDEAEPLAARARDLARSRWRPWTAR